MARFARSTDTVPEPCRILGTWLRPFCLGHHLLLKRLNLPFADAPDAVCEVDEFVVALLICAAPSYDWTLDAFMSGRWPQVVAQWRREARGPWWRRRRADWQGAMGLFRGYLTDGYEKPPLNRHRATPGTIELTAPWEVLLKCRLTLAGFSESEVLNGYLPARWYEYFTLKEMRDLDECRDVALWRKTFYTAKEHYAMHPEESRI